MEEKKDKRYEYLRKLTKNVFETLANGYRIDDGNTGIIVRGKGKEICKCTFSEKYRKDYIELFEITFAYKKCKFEYAGIQKMLQEFNRNIAIKNAVKYFKKENIDLDYVFNSQSDKYLFSRLIYKYIEKLLDVIFNDYNCTGKKRNNLVSQRYTSVLDNIRFELNTNDIHELIYNGANFSDIEIITYNNRDISECDHVMLVDFGYEFKDYLFVEDINTSIKLRSVEKSTFSGSSKLYQNYYELNLINQLKINCTKNINYYPIDLKILKNKEQYVPRYCCIAFCLSEIKEAIFSDEDNIEERIYDKLSTEAYVYIKEKYINPKVQRLNYIKQIEKILEILLNINYRKYFDKKEYMPDIFQKEFCIFNTFLEKSNLMIDEKNVIFKYLISIWIDDFSSVLFCTNSDKHFRSVMNKTVLTKYEEIMSAYSKKDELEEINKLYKVFYEKNKKTIDSFKKKVVIKNTEYYETSLEVDSGKGFNPYSHLKRAIDEYSKMKQ